MTDFQGSEKAAASAEAAAAVGRRHPRGARGGDVQEAMIRYLSAEEYHEKAEEAGEADHEPEPPR